MRALPGSSRMRAQSLAAVRRTVARPARATGAHRPAECHQVDADGVVRRLVHRSRHSPRAMSSAFCARARSADVSPIAIWCGPVPARPACPEFSCRTTRRWPPTTRRSACSLRSSLGCTHTAAAMTRPARAARQPRGAGHRRQRSLRQRRLVAAHRARQAMAQARMHFGGDLPLRDRRRARRLFAGHSSPPIRPCCRCWRTSRRPVDCICGRAACGPAVKC